MTKKIYMKGVVENKYTLADGMYVRKLMENNDIFLSWTKNWTLWKK